MRSLRGVPAGRLVGIGVFILSLAPVRNRQLQHVCSSRRRSFVLGIECVLMSACIIVCVNIFFSVRACIYFSVCSYTVSIHRWVCSFTYVCLHMSFVLAQRVFNSSVCGCFYSDRCSLVKWVPALQQVINNSVLPQLFVVFLFVPDCWVTDLFNHLSVSVFLRLFNLHGNPEDNKYQESNLTIKKSNV